MKPLKKVYILYHSIYIKLRAMQVDLQSQKIDAGFVWRREPRGNLWGDAFVHCLGGADGSQVPAQGIVPFQYVQVVACQ